MNNSLRSSNDAIFFHETNTLSSTLFLLETAYVDMKMFYFPIEQQGGSQLWFISTITDHPVSTKKDVQNALILLTNVDKRVEQVIEILREGVSKKITTPKVTMADVPTQIKSVSDVDVESNPFYSSFKSLDNFSSEEIETFQSKAKTLIKDKIIPVYKKLYDYVVNEYIPACREEVDFPA